MRCIVVAVIAIVLVSSTAFGQVQIARVNENAPIYARPNPPSSLSPLRVAAAGTQLQVLSQDGDWIQVRFRDPQWGERIGWVVSSLITIRDPKLDPMDLSIAQEAPPTGSQGRIARQPAPAEAGEGLERGREGFWFNIGLGYGSFGCEDCLDRDDGLSGGLSLGRSVNDHLLLGVGTTGYAKTVLDELFAVGTLDMRARIYPSSTYGFFFTGGVGLGTMSYAGESEVGLGVVLGIGYDFRVGRKVSITPFWNGLAMANSSVDGNVGQLGVGVTIH